MKKNEKSTKKDYLFYAIVALLFLQFAYYAAILPSFQIISTDGFEYFNNARFFIGEYNIYSGLRPIVLPLLYVPFMFLNRIDFLNGINLIGPKITALLFSAGSLVLCYVLFRKFLDRRASITGVFLISLNTIFIRNVEMTLTDIPTMFFIILTFFVYLKTRKSKNNLLYFLTSFFILLTIMTKFTALFIIFSIVLYEMLLKNFEILKSKRFWLMLLMPGFLVYALLSLGYTAYYGFDINSFIGVFKTIKFQVAPPSYYGAEDFFDPWYENVAALIKSSSWPIFILFLAGLAYSFFNPKKKDKLFISWFLVFFIALTFIVGHHESRYITPLIPAYYYFIARIIGEMGIKISRMAKKKKMAAASLLALFFILPIYNGALETLSFEDPFYRAPFYEEMIKYTDGITPKDNKIYWIGESHVIAPENYFFTIYDEYTYLSGVGLGRIDFYTNRISEHFYPPAKELVVINGFPYYKDIIHGNSSRQSRQEYITIERPLKENDSFIINTGKFMWTATLSRDKISPLYVSKVNFNYFTKKEVEKNCSEYSNDKLGKIIYCGSYLIPLVKEDVYEFYAEEGNDFKSIGIFNVLNSSRIDFNGKTERILLISYSQKKTFDFFEFTKEWENRKNKVME